MLARIGKIAFALVALFALIQFIPYGRSHTNPQVVAEPAWNSATTRDLAVAACFDCHSNETTWPWYTNVAPVSWLAQRDVDSGRGRLNFSEWTGTAGREQGEVAEAVQGGEMPPSYYVLMHPNARLTAAEKDALVQGLQATFNAQAGESD